jgi:hypothetical protein
MIKSKLLAALFLVAPLGAAYAQSADLTSPPAANTPPIYTPQSAATNATNESAPSAPVVDGTATNATPPASTPAEPSVKQKIKNGAHTVKRDAKRAKEEIKSDSKEAWHSAKSGAKSAKEEIKTGSKRAWNGVKEGAHEVKDKVKSTFKGSDNQSAPAPVVESRSSANSDTTLSNSR